MVDASRIHTQVRHKAQANQTRGQNAMGLQILKQGRATSIGHIHKHDVGLRRTHAQTRHALQALGQSMRQGMVVGQAVHMVVQGVQSRCRQNAGLAQTTTQHLAPAQCLGDQFTRATQGRAYGRAQALAETHRHAVKTLRNTPSFRKNRAAGLRSLRDGGMLLIGEPFWRQLPPSDAVAQGCLAHAVSDFLTLPQLLANLLLLQDVLGRWLQLDLAGQAPAGAAPDAPADGPPVFDPRTLPALIGDDAALIADALMVASAIEAPRVW